jgi:hypothetical protein
MECGKFVTISTYFSVDQKHMTLKYGNYRTLWTCVTTANYPDVMMPSFDIYRGTGECTLDA